jgi:hypothetical protein
LQNPRLAAADLGITTQTLRNYARRWEELRVAIREAKGRMLDTAEDKLKEAIERGEAWAICFFLKCQGKGRGYVERAEHRVGADPKAPPLRAAPATLTADDLKEIPLDARKALLDVIRKKRAMSGDYNGASSAQPEGKGDRGLPALPQPT